MSDVEPVAPDSLQEEAGEDAEYPEGEEHPEGAEQVTPQAEVEQAQDVEVILPGEEDQIVEEVEEVEEEVEKHELETLRAELEKVQAQAAEYLDGWQRARAEFANYKKRVEVEREELRRTSNKTLLFKLLPVIDDFERAFQTLPEDLADVPWVEGLAMILRKLQAILESEDVTPIEAAGQPFDPQWHEAVMQEETTEHPDGYVSAEIQRGYRLGERVLRPSMVKVASNEKEVMSERGNE